MSLDLWISVAVAIPLAVLANLATPKFQKWLDAITSKGKERKIEGKQKKRQAQLTLLENELKETEALVSEPSKLTNQNFNALLKVSLYGAFGALYGSLFSFIGEFGGWDGILGLAGRLGAQCTALFASMLIFITVSKALKTNRRVNEYQKYKVETEQLISELRDHS
jgi:H+/gluconate symporter-like permease